MPEGELVIVLLYGAAIFVLTIFLALFSYVHRLYQEKGRGATRRIRGHLEHFHDNLAGRLKMDPRRAMQTFGLLSQLTMGLAALTIGFAAVEFARGPVQAVFNTIFFIVLELLLVFQFASYVLLSRSRGDWLVPLMPLLRLLGYMVMPLLALYGFGVSLLHLVEEEEVGPPKEEEQEQAIEDLVEEGKERGIFEQEDVALIASVLEFADCTARDLMTPRPEIIGIEGEKSVAELRALMGKESYSRVLVYGKSQDEVLGVVNVHDVLRVPESEAATRKVSELKRPVIFVPETKRVVELVSELQKAHYQVVVVVDEYGNTAGLVTIRDLAEEVIGEISDADQVRRAEILPESENSCLVRAGVYLEKLEETLGVELDAQGNTTFAGLVHTWFGYVPKPGEFTERDGLKVEVLEATPRRVVRLRVTVLTPAATEETPAAKSGQN